MAKKSKPTDEFIVTKDGLDISTFRPDKSYEEPIPLDIDPATMTEAEFLSPEYEIDEDVLDKFLRRDAREEPPMSTVEQEWLKRVMKWKNHYTLLRKKKFLRAYERIGPNISMVCKIAGTTRQNVNRWKQDIDFLEALEAVEQSFIDRVEHTMFRVAWNEKHTVKNPVPGIIILKTKAADRGYIERQDVHQRIDIHLTRDQIDAVASAYQKVKDVTPIKRISAPVKPLPLPGFEKDYNHKRGKKDD